MEGIQQGVPVGEVHSVEVLVEEETLEGALVMKEYMGALVAEWVPEEVHVEVA